MKQWIRRICLVSSLALVIVATSLFPAGIRYLKIKHHFNGMIKDRVDVVPIYEELMDVVQSNEVAKIGYADFCVPDGQDLAVGVLANYTNVVVATNHLATLVFLPPFRDSTSTGFHEELKMAYSSLPSFPEIVRLTAPEVAARVELLTLKGGSSFGVNKIVHYKSKYTEGLVYVGKAHNDYSSMAFSLTSLDSMMNVGGYIMISGRGSEAVLDEYIRVCFGSFRFSLSETPIDAGRLSKKISQEVTNLWDHTFSP